MKKATIAVALLGTMGLAGTASAFDASQVFTWSGSVPVAPVSNSFVIAQPDGSPITNGLLTFSLDSVTNKGVLTGSTELRFNVFKELGNTNQPDLTPTGAATLYGYKLTSLAINKNGMAAEQDQATGYFAIQGVNASVSAGAAVKLVKNTLQTGAKGETILSVIKSGVSAPGNQPLAGESVDVQATIVIEGAA